MAVEPICFTQGDSVEWTRVEGDYLPVDGWTLEYTLASECTTHDITAADDGNGGHLVSLTATQTAAFAPGVYQWSARVANSPDRKTIDRGSVEILADFSAANFSKVQKSDAQKMLDHYDGLLTTIGAASETELEGWRRKGQDPDKILQVRNYWADRVREEKAETMKKLGRGNPSLVRGRFRRLMH